MIFSEMNLPGARHTWCMEEEPVDGCEPAGR